MATRGYLSPDTTGQGREMYVAEADYGALARSERLRGEQAKSIFEGGQQAIAGYAQYKMGQLESQIEKEKQSYLTGAEEQKSAREQLIATEDELAALKSSEAMVWQRAQSEQLVPGAAEPMVKSDTLAGLEARLERLRAAADTGAIRQKEFQNRVDTLVKESISSMPGLAKDIRSLAGQVTGIEGMGRGDFARVYASDTAEINAEFKRRQALAEENRKTQREGELKNADAILELFPQPTAGMTNVQISAILKDPSHPAHASLRQMQDQAGAVKQLEANAKIAKNNLEMLKTTQGIEQVGAERIGGVVISAANSKIVGDVIKSQTSPAITEYNKLSDADKNGEKGLALLEQHRIGLERTRNNALAEVRGELNSLVAAGKMTQANADAQYERAEKSIKNSFEPFINNAKLTHEASKVYWSSDIRNPDVISKKLGNIVQFDKLANMGLPPEILDAYSRGPGDKLHDEIRKRMPSVFAQLDQRAAIINPLKQNALDALSGLSTDSLGVQMGGVAGSATQTGTYVPTQSGQSAPVTNEVVTSVGLAALNKGVANPKAMTDQDLNSLASWVAHSVGDGASGGAAGKAMAENMAKLKALTASMSPEQKTAFQAKVNTAIDDAMHSTRPDQAGGRSFYFINGSLHDGFPKDANNEPVAHVVIGPQKGGGGISYQVVKNPRYTGTARFEDYANKQVRAEDIQMVRDKAAMIAAATGQDINAASWALASSLNAYIQNKEWIPPTSILSRAKDNPIEFQAYKSGQSSVSIATGELGKMSLEERGKLSSNDERLRSYARDAAKRNGLPDNLVDRVMSFGERSKNSGVVSPAGAKGIMQFIDSTRQAYPHDPKDPIQSIDAGAKYLADLVKQYGGNVRAAVAHYNGGEKAGQAVLAGKEPPAKETQDYLKRVFSDGAVPEKADVVKKPDNRTVEGTVTPAPQQSQIEAKGGTAPVAPTQPKVDTSANDRVKLEKTDKRLAEVNAQLGKIEETQKTKPNANRAAKKVLESEKRELEAEKRNLESRLPASPAPTPAPAPNKPDNRTIEGKVTPAPASAVKGQVEAGNIDLTTRPVVKNKDGSISTVRSMSVNIDGVEVLIPTVSEKGTIMTKERAIKEYKRTGKHLGKFETPEDATAYAEQLHKDQEKLYTGKRGKKK